MSAVVIGASRGIGLAVVRALAQRGEEPVFATYRRDRAELDELLVSHRDSLVPVQLDITDEPSIAAAAAQVRERVDRLDLVLNVAGVLHGPGMSPERRIEQLDGANLALSFAVHATGPALVAKHFHRLLGHGDRAVFASLSARVGSIGDNRLGGWYGYRASKAAQNMITKTLSIELSRRAPNLICVGLHPGTVDTGLSKPFQRNVPAGRLFSTERAADQLLSVVDSLTTEDSGQVFDWKREPIPW